jgi:hypothetical protein
MLLQPGVAYAARVVRDRKSEFLTGFFQFGPAKLLAVPWVAGKSGTVHVPSGHNRKSSRAAAAMLLQPGAQAPGVQCSNETGAA